jgi:hypothetical protein
VINFRYHVVSLTAVFLALAIGLIVGTSALNGPLSDSLQHRVDSLTKSNDTYRQQTVQLEAEVSEREQFATEVAPLVLGGKLQGRRVLVLSFQESSDYVTDMVSDLKLAGAKVTGQVEIQDAMMRPSNGPALLDLEHNANTPDVNMTNIPALSDGVQTATALLAGVLTDRQQAPLSDSAINTVLTAYEKSGYIDVNGKVTGPAEAIVILAPPPYTDQEAAAENANVVTLIDQFDKAGALVVGAAGNAGKGNVIGTITGDASLSANVSTVDNVNTPQGRIAAVLALTEQVVYGKAGHYGITSSATSKLPVLPAS